MGKAEEGKEAARADLLSQEEGRRGVILTLVTSVASAYVNLRDLDKQLEIAKRTAKSRKETYDLFQLRFRGGVISELELSQVKSDYEQALATIPFLEKVIAQQENALCVLIGRNPGPIPAGKESMTSSSRQYRRACLPSSSPNVRTYARRNRP